MTVRPELTGWGGRDVGAEDSESRRTSASGGNLGCDAACHRGLSENPALSSQNPFLGSDFEEVHSRVYALALEPGDCDYAVLAVNHRYMDDPATVHRVVKHGVGEIVYGGEIWLENRRQGVEGSIRKQWERDLVAFESTFPLLPLNQVRIRLFE